MALINVPLATQSLGQTNASIRANWNSIVASYEVDHVPFNNLTDTGFHKKVTFEQQVTVPIAVVDPSIMMYNTIDTTTTMTPQLYIKRQADGANLGTPFTSTGVDAGTNPERKGWYVLPCGLIVKFGFVSIGAGNIETGDILLTPGPTMTAIYNVQVSPYVGGSAANPQNIHFYVSTTNVTSFKIKSNSSVAYVAFYQVIGTATF